MAATSRFELVDRILDGNLLDWLTAALAADESLDTIARRLDDEYGVTVSRETVRRWVKTYELDQNEAREATA